MNVLLNRLGPLQLVGLLIASSAMLSWVAFFNGFPLVFNDTETYVTLALKSLQRGSLAGGWVHSPVYSFLILPLHAKLSLWPVVVAQGLLISHLLLLFVRSFLPEMTAVRFLLFVAAMALLSSLPWFTALVTPGIFCGVSVLGLFLIGFKGESLSRLELIYVIPLTAIAVSTHFAYLPLGIGLLLISLPLLRWVHGAWSAALRGVAFMTLPVLAAAGVLTFGNNLIVSDGSKAANRSNVVLLARLLESGAALDYLEETCAKENYLLCSELDELGTKFNFFLWSPKSPLKRIGVTLVAAEADDIVRGTLEAFPARVAIDALRQLGLQLSSFRTGNWLYPYPSPEHAHKKVNKAIAQYFPHLNESYVNSRQSSGQLRGTGFVSLHYAAAIAATLILLWTGWRALREQRRLIVALCIYTCTAMIGSAFITGAFVLVRDRYQSRAMWVVVFVAVLLALVTRKNARSPSDTRVEESGG